MLAKLKLLLGVANDDTSRDDLLSLLIDMAQGRLLLLIGAASVPASLEHIIIDVALARFNRIGSEGLSSHTVEGETQTFSDDDFTAYADDIQAYNAAQEGSSPGSVRFL